MTEYLSTKEYLNKLSAQQIVTPEVINWHKKMLEHGLDKLGFATEIGEEEHFDAYIMEFRGENISGGLTFLCKESGHQKATEIFGEAAKMYKNMGIELNLTIFNQGVYRALYAVKKNEAGKTIERYMVGVANDNVRVFDLAHIMSLKERLRYLHQEWHYIGHLAANGHNFYETYAGRGSGLMLRTEKELEDALATLETIYASLYKEYSEAFLSAAPQPNPLINRYLTFAKTTEGILDENSTLVRGFFPYLFELIIRKHIQQFGHIPTRSEWENIDLDSIKEYVKSLAFLRNGLLGTNGHRIMMSYLFLARLENGTLLLRPTAEWNLVRREKIPQDAWHMMVREFTSNAFPLAEIGIFKESGGLGFQHGKTGACPLGGEVEGMEHAYDVFTQIGYQFIREALAK